MVFALQRLGELDPFDIKKTTLLGVKQATMNLSEKDLFNRGVLTVRKYLNRHLGKSGKYTNRMIKKTARILAREADGCVYLTANLPKKDTLKIVSATYMLLRTYDKAYCTLLFNTETNDIYKEKLHIKSTLLTTVFPIQTNIVLRSKPATDIGINIKEYLKEVAYG